MNVFDDLKKEIENLSVSKNPNAKQSEADFYLGYSMALAICKTLVDIYSIKFDRQERIKKEGVYVQANV